MAAALAGAGTASAQVDLTLDSVGSPGNNDYASVGTVTIVANSIAPNTGININESGVEAGVYNLTVNTVATPSFCIDIADNQSEGTLYNNYSYTSLALAPNTPAGPMGATAAATIERLWAQYYAPNMTALQAAGLQVAIWEEVALGNGTYSLTVSGNTPITQQAANDITGLNQTGPEADLVALVSTAGPSDPVGQGYIVAVPEATTVIAGALLLLPLGASAFRILRKTRKP